MIRYPVYVPRDPYHGCNASRRRKAEAFNRVAARVEAHINAVVAKWPDDTFDVLLSGLIAINLGEESRLVHDVVFALDCGSNGVTVLKGDAERAWLRGRTPPAEAGAAGTSA